MATKPPTQIQLTVADVQFVEIDDKTYLAIGVQKKTGDLVIVVRSK
jgi:hypothetical protein